MPTYEYRCERGHQYEKREGFDAPAKQKCPQCGKLASRLLFAPPVVFKGSGFYKTDSRGSGKSDTSSEPASTATAAASSESTDAKPATPAPEKPSDAPAAESAAAS